MTLFVRIDVRFLHFYDFVFALQFAGSKLSLVIKSIVSKIEQDNVSCLSLSSIISTSISWIFELLIPAKMSRTNYPRSKLKFVSKLSKYGCNYLQDRIKGSRSTF